MYQSFETEKQTDQYTLQVAVIDKDGKVDVEVVRRMSYKDMCLESMKHLQFKFGYMASKLAKYLHDEYEPTNQYNLRVGIFEGESDIPWMQLPVNDSWYEFEKDERAFALGYLAMRLLHDLYEGCE